MPKTIRRYDTPTGIMDESPDGEYVLYGVVAEKDAEIKRLREAIKGALRIEDLWMPGELSSEKYLEETRSLHYMKLSFLDVLEEDL